MPEQLTFARITDPATSHEAGESMRGEGVNRQQYAVLGALAWSEVGSRPGSTAWEVSGWLMIQQNVASKRLGELTRSGHAQIVPERRPGGSGRMLQVYRLTSEGREALGGLA